MNTTLYETGNDMCQVEIYKADNLLKIDIYDPNTKRGGAWSGTVKDFLEDNYIGGVIIRELGEATLQEVVKKAEFFLKENS